MHGRIANYTHAAEKYGCSKSSEFTTINNHYIQINVTFIFLAKGRTVVFLNLLVGNESLYF